MKKKIIWILVTLAMIPVLYFGFIISLLYWDSLGYKAFQREVRQEFEKLNNDNLSIHVCHEWKCIFKYKDPKMEKYSFLIFGEKKIKERLNLMQEIYTDFESNRGRCRYIQEHSNTCQL